MQSVLLLYNNPNLKDFHEKSRNVKCLDFFIIKPNRNYPDFYKVSKF